MTNGNDLLNSALSIDESIRVAKEETIYVGKLSKLSSK